MRRFERFCKIICIFLALPHLRMVHLYRILLVWCVFGAAGVYYAVRSRVRLGQQGSVHLGWIRWRTRPKCLDPSDAWRAGGLLQLVLITSSPFS